MRPKKNYASELFDRNRERKIMLIVNAIFLLVSLFFLFTKYHVIYAVIMAAILAFNAVRLFLWIRTDDAKIKDTTDCRIDVTPSEFTCVQVSAEDALEECAIRYEDIIKVVESTKKGECGFYLFLREDNNSIIYQNENRTDREVFYVDGTGYDCHDFTDLYWNLLDRLSDDTVMVGTANQKSWMSVSANAELVQLIIPYALMIGLVVLRIFQGV